MSAGDSGATIPGMTTYRVPVDISGHIGGEPFEFTAGEYDPEPSSPEAVALAYLADQGHLAEPPADEPPADEQPDQEPAPRRRTRKTEE